jgi:hypothetical protein
MFGLVAEGHTFWWNSGEENLDSGSVFDSCVLVQKVADERSGAQKKLEKKAKRLVQFSCFSIEKLEKVKTNMPIGLYVAWGSVSRVFSYVWLFVLVKMLI